MSLFTLLTRDRWGHGIPSAWMMSSNAKESTISFFLGNVKSRFPKIEPAYFMSDKDRAQLNSIETHFPNSTILLCWWHVLHAWHQHMVTNEFPELWELLKRWVRMTDTTEFWKTWDTIKQTAPQSVVDYLNKEWMDEIQLWSAVFRTDRSIFQDSDTNMLVEAWHHVLKGKFMQGKRNRRLDQLIYILIREAVPHYIFREHYQNNGCAGPDLEVRERLRIEELAKSIPEEDIQECDLEGTSCFMVRSQMRRDVYYNVDLDTYDCDCLSFPKVMMCKHIIAVQLHFEETFDALPASTLDINSPDSFEHDGAILSTSSEELSQEKDINATHTNAQPVRELISSLSALISRLRDTPSSRVNLLSITKMQQSVSQLNDALPVIDAASILPPKAIVPPNQKPWLETAQVMGMPVKGKRKSTHSDAYAGGERSGKKAKADARAAPAPTQPVMVTFALTDGPAASTNTTAIASGSNTALPEQPTFDAANFNLSDLPLLKSLKRGHLNELCKLHRVSAGGTNNALIERLSSISAKTQDMNPT
ncbi:hypothetical protein NMY22_g2518 [Coprinellus aureogranulatus]|nr:hypothetical protein NMY22_g2518 [Coprinellus aureogranulatus]